MFLVHGGLGGLHALLDPAAPLGIADVHELRAHRAAVHAARFAGEFAFHPQLWMRYRRQKTEGVEVSFQISPAAESVKHTLAFVGRLHRPGKGSFSVRFWSARHELATSIKDEAGCVPDSHEPGGGMQSSSHSCIFGGHLRLPHRPPRRGRANNPRNVLVVGLAFISWNCTFPELTPAFRLLFTATRPPGDAPRIALRYSN